jgi:hypothetical protein
MLKVSRETGEIADYGMVEDRHADLEDYAVGFATFREDIDHRALLKGLPDDSCQCPHWGYVLKGRWTCRFGEREEVFEAGDAFYMPPGHIPLSNEPGTEVLLFSPRAELRQTEEVIMKNVQALQAAG